MFNDAQSPYDMYAMHYHSSRTLAATIFEVRTSFPLERSWNVSPEVLPGIMREYVCWGLIWSSEGYNGVIV
jgi:hypothetical protein